MRGNPGPFQLESPFQNASIQSQTMKNLLFAAAFAVCAGLFASDTAQAQVGCNGIGFFPYGFYQPYGARFGTSLQTPPYFATNPPVYYGARYARPYGISPFASPPVVTAPAGYQGRLRSNFQQKPLANPNVSSVNRPAARVAKKGKVQTNPFVESEPTDRFAKK